MTLPGVTVFEIRSKLRRLQAEHGLGMVLIDYLQLIEGRGGTVASRRSLRSPDR